jgi:hypothetical protein
MVNGSSNLKINNIEITTTLAMMKFFDSYCFVMLKKSTVTDRWNRKRAIK